MSGPVSPPPPSKHDHNSGDIPSQDNTAHHGRRAVKDSTLNTNKQLPSDSDYYSGTSISSRSSSTSDVESLLSPHETDNTPPVFLTSSPTNAPLNKSACITGYIDHGSTAHIRLVEQTDMDGNTEQFAFKEPIHGDCQREADILKGVKDHPNIVKYYGMHAIEGKSGLLFERVNGPTLEKVTFHLIDQLQEGDLSLRDFFNAYAYLQKQQLQALAHLEKHNIVHCDYKPSNSLFHTESGLTKLIDFGQSSKQEEPAHFGHEDYAAPEAFLVLEDQEVEVPAKPAMDSFGFGQSLYRAVSLLETGEATSFAHTAMTSGYSSSERDATYFMKHKAMRAFALSKTDNPVIANDEQSIHNCCLRAASMANKEIPDFETLSVEAEQAKAYLSPMIDLTNGLMKAKPGNRTLASEALTHPWFTACIYDEKQALQTITAVT